MIARFTAAAALTATLAAALAGCVSYANYPPVPKNVAINDPNTPAMEEVMIAGMQWVTAKYPAGPEGTPFAVNLPPGTKPVVYQRIVAAAGKDAQPLTADTASLPTYHVVAMRVRGDQANIWIDRPVTAFGNTPQGDGVYQEVKLWLQGGLSPWHVVNVLERTPGTAEIPEPNFYEPAPPPSARPSPEHDAVYKPGPKAQPAPPQAEPAAEPKPESPVPPPGTTPNG
jgi:hypothetical protein